jgi:eukaryotic-like serine/threonine-protein kinase
MAKRGFFDRILGREQQQRPWPADYRAGWILQPEQVLVDNYRIRDLIGQGGLGQVFVADDLKLKMLVAIKVPAPSILSTPAGAEHFLQEAQYAARLRPHPHIVLISACLTDPNLRMAGGYEREDIEIPFIVMDYLGGGDLAARLKRGALDMDQIPPLFGSICDAIHFAHTKVYEREGKRMRGLLHRDLKPQNICFDESGRPVVVDFGLARVLEDPSTSGGIKGTPMYMAPEQWSPSRGIDQRTDIYALGVILFQMVTGRLPFEKQTFEEYLAAHLFEEPPDPRQLRPDLPSPVAEAILTALQKEKDARFKSVQALANAVSMGFLGTHAEKRVTALKPAVEEGAVGPSNKQQCSFCNQFVTPDKLGDRLFCSSCGQVWVPAHATEQVKEGSWQHCRICGQSMQPGIVAGKHFCSNCGNPLTDTMEPHIAAGSNPNQGENRANVDSDSSCPGCGTSGRVTIAGRIYCENCGQIL